MMTFLGYQIVLQILTVNEAQIHEWARKRGKFINLEMHNPKDLDLVLCHSYG